MRRRKRRSTVSSGAWRRSCAPAPPPASIDWERMTSSDLVAGPDGKLRCRWGASTPDYAEYHDHEWGRPVRGDDRLFERLVLEAFQSGLSWLTILRKRENF